MQTSRLLDCTYDEFLKMRFIIPRRTKFDYFSKPKTIDLADICITGGNGGFPI